MENCSLVEALGLLKCKTEAFALVSLSIETKCLKRYVEGALSLIHHQILLRHQIRKISENFPNCGGGIESLVLQHISLLKNAEEKLLSKMEHRLSKTRVLQSSVHQYAEQNLSIARELDGIAQVELAGRKRRLAELEQLLSTAALSLMQAAKTGTEESVGKDKNCVRDHSNLNLLKRSSLSISDDARGLDEEPSCKKLKTSESNNDVDADKRLNSQVDSHAERLWSDSIELAFHGDKECKSSSMQRRGQIADHNDLPNSNFSTDNFATPLRSSALSARSPPAGSSEKTVSNTTTPSLSSQEIVISENPPKSS